jgi:murein DD-endopeptidase MepM/ murein hydrolase activator NlpD
MGRLRILTAGLRVIGSAGPILALVVAVTSVTFREATAMQGRDTLRNRDVIGLSEAGVGDSVIVAKMRNAQCDFDLSTDALIELKRAGVSEGVLQAMIGGCSQLAGEGQSGARALMLPSAYGYYVVEGDAIRPLVPTRVTWVPGIAPVGAFNLAWYGVDGLSGEPEFTLQDSLASFVMYDHEVDPRNIHLAKLVYVDHMRAYEFNVRGTDPPFFYNVYRKNYDDPVRVGLWRVKVDIPLQIEPIQDRRSMYRLTPARPFESGRYAFYHEGALYPDNIIITRQGSASPPSAFYFGMGTPGAKGMVDVTGSSTMRNHPVPGTAILEDYGVHDQGGPEDDPRLRGYHVGIDFEGPGQVVAAADGKVALLVSIKKKKKDKDYGFGNTLILAHDLENGDKIYTLYAHLSDLNPELVIERRVAKGERLGTMSASGDGKDKYWIHASGPGGRCYRPGIAFGPDWCERLHFEVKTKPVLENPEGGKACRKLGVFRESKTECYGYTPEDPGSYGYLNPWQFIRGQLPIIASHVAPPEEGPSEPDREPEIPSEADATRERWDRFVSEETKAIAQMPQPNSDWRELVSMEVWGDFDSYQELYLLAVNQRSLAADALASVSFFLREDNFANATRYAVLYTKYYQASNEMFKAAEQVSAGAIQTTAEVLDGFYRAASEGSRYGWYLMCGPKCYEVADWTFMMVDFAVDARLQGAEEATRNAMVKGIASVLLKWGGLGNWVEGRTTHHIGRSGLYSLMDQTIGSPEFQKEVIKFLAESGAYGATRLTEQSVADVIEGVLDFVHRSSNIEPQQ